QVLRLYDGYDASIFKLYTEEAADLGEVLKRGIPIEARPARAFLRYILQSGKQDDVRRVWDWIQDNSLADDALAPDYGSYLLDQKRWDEARQSWVAYLKDRNGDYPESNLLFNGSFESVPIPAPLDWRFYPLDGTSADRDSVAHSGKWSMKVHFAGRGNLD